MDNDGDPDMALIVKSAHKVQVFQNLSGTLDLWWETTLINPTDDTEVVPSDVEWADMDGDLDLDLAVAGSAYHKGFVFRNTGVALELLWAKNPNGNSSLAWGDL